ncbi:MAG TPA: flagellar M-ring protein FliF C-terminal domain-containing protein, partial [Verrucomicrobiae bacterium]|nr:flagellar M-ring protein FliF C-terminal domain-containing protein [Verrucomicrobiae bacterium]
DGQVIRTQTKNDENNDSSVAIASTAAGISANASQETNSAAAPTSNTRNHKATSTVEYEIGKTTSNVMQAAGGIKRLSASVTVAEKMDGVGADRKPVARTPEEIDKLRRIVTSAVGIMTGTDNTRGDTVTLEELPFNDQFITDVTKELDVQQKHDFWANIIRNSAYPAAGLAVLFFLVTLFKRTPVQDIPIGVPVGRLMRMNGNGNGNGHTNGNGNGHSNGNGHGLDLQPGVVTVDVLNKLIKENPANMTQAIRDWMNKGRTTSN